MYAFGRRAIFVETGRKTASEMSFNTEKFIIEIEYRRVIYQALIIVI